MPEEAIRPEAIRASDIRPEPGQRRETQWVGRNEYFSTESKCPALMNIGRSNSSFIG